MFTKEFYVQAVLGLLYALIPTGIIVDALGYALFCWPWYLHAIIVLLIVIAGLLVLLWRRRLYPFRNLKMTDLVPYVLEEREVSKSYNGNTFLINVKETIIVTKERDLYFPVSIKFSSRNPKMDNEPNVNVIRKRDKNTMPLTKDRDYDIVIRKKTEIPDNGEPNIYKCDIYIKIPQNSLKINDLYIITASRNVTADNTHWMVGSNASVYGIKKIVLKWQFPSEEEFDSIRLKVINEFICQIKNNQKYQNYTIEKEIKRIKKQNKVADNLQKTGTLTINHPIYGLTYRIKGEKSTPVCPEE